MASNTKTGPVLPIMVSGWPAKNAHKMPTTAAERILSIAACNHSSVKISPIITFGFPTVFLSYHVIACMDAQDGPKGHYRRQRGKVQENDGGQTLKRKAIAEIADVIT